MIPGGCIKRRSFFTHHKQSVQSAVRACCAGIIGDTAAFSGTDHDLRRQTGNITVCVGTIISVVAQSEYIHMSKFFGECCFSTFIIIDVSCKESRPSVTLNEYSQREIIGIRFWVDFIIISVVFDLNLHVFSECKDRSRGSVLCTAKIVEKSCLRRLRSLQRSFIIGVQQTGGIYLVLKCDMICRQMITAAGIIITVRDVIEDSAFRIFAIRFCWLFRRNGIVCFRCFFRVARRNGIVCFRRFIRVVRRNGIVCFRCFFRVARRNSIVCFPHFF